MQYKKTVLFLSILGALSIGFADTPWDQHTSLQAFHQAGDPPVLPVKASLVKPIEKKQAPLSSVVEKENSPATKPTSENPIETANVSLDLVKEQIELLNQNDILFQQAANQKINNLSQEVMQLHKQVAQLNQAILLLNQEVQTLNKSSTVPAAASLLSKNTDSEDYIGPLQDLSNYLIWTVAILIIVILLTIIWMRRPREKPLSAESFSSDDTKSEYDYMGSSESIPAKLNLIRAYIAMENFTDARKVIEEVIAYGDERYSKEALEMRKGIPVESVE